MPKFEVSYSDDSVTFVDPRTMKAEKLALMDVMEDGQAIRVINAEIKGRESVSQASVSVLAKLLDSPRLDGYKGKTPANVAVPKELKAAVRDIETEILKPMFVATMPKSMSQGHVETNWQNFASGLREGGGYANAKSRVLTYFAVCGKLPKCDNGKLLSVAAIDKLIANEKAKLAPTETGGIAGKLFALCGEVNLRNEKTDLGDYATALASLHDMLATYEGLYSEYLEKITDAKGNTELTKASNDAIAAAKAKGQPTMALPDEEQARLQKLADEYTAQWTEGSMSDVGYQIAMSEIGFDVVLKEPEDAPF